MKIRNWVVLTALSICVCLTGYANPLREMHEQAVADAQKNLRDPKLDVIAKSIEYWFLACGLDALGKHKEALEAIELASQLNKSDKDIQTAHPKILSQLGEIDKGLAIISPLASSLRGRAQEAKTPQEAFALVLGDQAEIFLAEMHLYTSAGKWSEAIQSLAYAHDVVNAKNFYPYRTLWYLVLKAKGGKPVESLERGISISSTADNHYGKLIKYWLNEGSLDEITKMIAKKSSPTELQDARAEGLFFVAMKERLVNGNEAAYQATIGGLNTLSPYGSTEWSLVKAREK
jgi:tetratricopeptide (TPR) repeat protein